MPPALLPPGTALVGGAVRDALLGRLRECPDLDLVVEDDAVELGRLLVSRLGGTCVVLDADRSMARLVLEGWTIDLARRCGANLTADLGRRDYTVNAIALPLDRGQEELLDPTGGLEDLREGWLRAISEANLLDDPLRLLRGPRLAAELGFRLTPQTWQWIQLHHNRLASVAGERVLVELDRLATAPSGLMALQQVLEGGLLESWGGSSGDDRETKALLGLLTQERAKMIGLSAQEAVEALRLARLSAVLQVSALVRLRASRRLQQRSEALRRWQLRLLPQQGHCASLMGLPEAQRLALHRDLEQDLPALLLQLEPSQALNDLRRWRNPADPLFHPRSPLDGRRLQRELRLRQGRQLGELMDHLAGERAFGRLPPEEISSAEILMAARQWLASQSDQRHD